MFILMPTLGQRLKAAREERRLTLEQAFEATRIRVAYLRALEEDDLSVMPSPVQARGYLRNYAAYLGLDLDRLLEEVRASQQPEEKIIGPADQTPPPAVQTPEPFSPPQDSALLSPPAVDTAPSAESQPEPLPPQPKRRGRKKAEASASPAEEPAPSKPKRRTRKKDEASSEAESVLAAETPPVVPAEAAPLPEPAPQPYTPPGAEQPSQPDVRDSLWQAWLNRVSGLISSRNKQTDEPQEVPEAPQAESLQTETIQPETLQPSAEIFKEIGRELRARREMLSLHIEEVERNTHIKTHYLEALEQGAMDRLPSAVQTRGMLSNYASFLDMDVDAILLRFADALQARHREKNPPRPVRKPGQPILANLPTLSNFIAGDLIFGIGMAVMLVGFVIWGINRVLTLQSLQAIEPTAPSISDVLLSTPDPSQFTATPTLLPVEAFANEATPTIIIPTINANVRVQVNLVAVERTYLRVVADGKVVFEGRVIPGNAYLFEAEQQIEVLTGSGGAIRLVYNGQDMGLMGGFGQIVHNIYLANEIITPTPLPTPSPTVTAPPSPTLRPTRTPVPSNTPLP
ncbi:MAG: RodZ domain-containing protein [Chloroflexota bacterium]